MKRVVGIGVALLVVAGVAWLALRTPAPERIEGRRTSAAGDAAVSPRRSAQPPGLAPAPGAPEAAPDAPRPAAPPNLALQLGDRPASVERLRELARGSDGVRSSPPPLGFPMLGKYTDRPLSDVPHRVIGAFDELPESSDLGDRRVFVLVADAGLPDEALETLAGDVSEGHGEARYLTLWVYDSEEAARAQERLPDGTLSYDHLLAEVRRNDRHDATFVRGARTSLRGVSGSPTPDRFPPGEKVDRGGSGFPPPRKGFSPPPSGDSSSSPNP